MSDGAARHSLFFDGQVAVITGAGHGLGRLYALELARRAALASRACEVTHHNHSACVGRFAPVFVSSAHGCLVDPAQPPSTEDFAARLDEVSATEPFTVRASIFDEIADICSRMGINQ